MLDEENKKELLCLLSHHLTRLIIQKGNSISLNIDIEDYCYHYLDECINAADYVIEEYLKARNINHDENNNIDISILNHFAKKWVKDFYKYELDEDANNKYASKLQEIKDSEMKIKIYNKLSLDNHMLYLFENEYEEKPNKKYRQTILCLADSEFKANLMNDIYNLDKSIYWTGCISGRCTKEDWDTKYKSKEELIKDTPLFILNE